MPDGALPSQAREEWGRRVVAEYQSAAITNSVVGWLLRAGASPTLIHDGIRIVEDEVVHAELSQLVFAAAGGREVRLDEAGLGLERDPARSLVADLALHGVRVFCLGETIAVRLFQRLRQAATVPEARTALDRILADEVRHRDFGWLLLEWLSLREDWNTTRDLLSRHLPGLMSSLRRGYGQGDDFAFDPRSSAWGLMPASEYGRILLETLERDLVPRFEPYGLDARAAFG